MGNLRKHVVFTDRELVTVLAALRYWDWEGGIEGVRTSIQADLSMIVTNGGSLAPLQSEEINALCERLNCGNDDQ